MPFELTVHFTGVCALVPNGELPHASKIMVLLPDGREPRNSSLDGQPMRRHRGFVKFPLRHLRNTSNLPADTEGVWYLERQRLGIDFGEGSAPGPLTVDWITLGPREPYPRRPRNDDEERSFSWTMNLNRVVPGGADVDPATLMAQPAATVLAQMVIENGALSATDLGNDFVWDFLPTMTGDLHRQVLAHQVSVRLPNLTSARLWTEPFEGGDRRYLDVEPQGDRAEVHVTNRCVENPLDWRWDQQPRDDDDTRWLWELLSPAAKLRVQLELGLMGDDRSLPLPRPRPGLGGGPNCSPGTMAPAAF